MIGPHARHSPALAWSVAFVLGLAQPGCSSDDEPSSWSYGGDRDSGTSDGLDAKADVSRDDASDGQTPDGDADQADVFDGSEASAPCPMDMVLVETVCMDRFEAPNRQGSLPLVMFHFDEASAWCEARGKRLCFDDEWTRVCGGEQGFAYPYGDEHVPGVCTDDKDWLAYDQELLNDWPWTLETDPIESLEALLEAARQEGAAAAADHIEWLYQADPSGSRAECTTGDGAYDLSGNVEEWTRRRSGGTDGFHGNLKGRYWADTRTCQQSIISHGDQFRFYEIGFRCCQDPQ